MQTVPLTVEKGQKKVLQQQSSSMILKTKKNYNGQ